MALGEFQAAVYACSELNPMCFHLCGSEGKCVAGPVLTRAQAKKSDKIHTLKVKEATSSVDKTAMEDHQKKDPTLKKCFD